MDAAHAGADIFKPIVGRGSAYADIDADGDQDVVLTQIAGPPLLLGNDVGLDRHWLPLKLQSTEANRNAIGAWIHARVDGQDLWRQVMPTRSYLSQSELPVTIGLGTNATVDLVEVIWPGGRTQSVTPLIDQLTVVHDKTGPSLTTASN